MEVKCAVETKVDVTGTLETLVLVLDITTNPVGKVVDVKRVEVRGWGSVEVDGGARLVADNVVYAEAIAVAVMSTELVIEDWTVRTDVDVPSRSVIERELEVVRYVLIPVKTWVWVIRRPEVETTRIVVLRYVLAEV